MTKITKKAVLQLLKEKYRSDKCRFKNGELAHAAYDLICSVDWEVANRTTNLFHKILDAVDGAEYHGNSIVFKNTREAAEYIWELANDFLPHSPKWYE